MSVLFREDSSIRWTFPIGIKHSTHEYVDSAQSGLNPKVNIQKNGNAPVLDSSQREVASLFIFSVTPNLLVKQILLLPDFLYTHQQYHLLPLSLSILRHVSNQPLIFAATKIRNHVVFPILSLPLFVKFILRRFISF